MLLTPAVRLAPYRRRRPFVPGRPEAWPSDDGPVAARSTWGHTVGRMVHAIDPRTARPLEPEIPDTTVDGVADSVAAARAAGESWRRLGAGERADVLESVAAAIEAAADELWVLADRETALGEARLRGEIARTAGQFRLFAGVLRDGGYVDAVIDHADPDATPPRPDVRRMSEPLPGVVAVFAASNFPFAFSVAGGDTASALAAGCAVVVKAHPGHPLTSARTAEVVRAALPDAGLLGLVHGVPAGAWLVQHRDVEACGFTGSVAGGRAIEQLIAERDRPIPFFGEQGSVNPVVVLPSAVAAGAQDVAAGFADSLSFGVGQFCTNPGLLFVPDDSDVLGAIRDRIEQTVGGPMLAERIRDGYRSGLERLSGLESLAHGQTGSGELAVRAEVVTTDLATFAAGLPDLAEECFGPAAVVVTYRDLADVPEVLEMLPGSLTATVHATTPGEATDVVEVLRRRAGRLVWNGWPTGVAVNWAMHHAGPWPASTNAAHTSVGAAAIKRWLTPTAYQAWPPDLLPPQLRDDNPLGITRRVDGELTTP